MIICLLIFLCFAFFFGFLSVSERYPLHSMVELYEMQKMLNNEIKRSETHVVKVNELINQLIQKQQKSEKESAERLNKLRQRIAEIDGTQHDSKCA